MTDSVPYEILAAINDHLSLKDIRHCIKVSRTWKTAFTPLLYCNVVLDSPTQFKSFVKTLNHTKSHTNFPGHFVRTLLITFDLEPKRLLPLSYLCPLLIKLNTKSICLPDILPRLKEWKYLAQMPRLFLDHYPDNFSLCSFHEFITDVELDMTTFPDLTDLVMELPFIEKLTVRGQANDIRSRGARIWIWELETIHEYLPHLQYLCLDQIYLYGKIPEYVKPCHTVKELSLTPLDDRCWPHYFRKKYTNLRVLSVNTGAKHDPEKLWRYGWGKIEQRERRIEEAVMILAGSCRRLTSFNSKREEISLRLYQRLYYRFVDIGAPITKLTLEHLGDKTILKLLSSFHRSLAALEIWTVWSSETFEQLLVSLASCSSLVNLRLVLGYFDTSIDRILDSCKTLDTLAISAANIYSSMHKNVEESHALKTLIIESAQFQNGIFQHLSRRCSHLSVLKCKHNGSPHSYGNNHPSRVERVQYRAMDLHNWRLRELHICASASTLFKLTSTHKSQRKLERYQKYFHSVNIIGDMRWLRWYRNNSEKDYFSIRRLREHEVMNIENGDDQKLIQKQVEILVCVDFDSIESIYIHPLCVQKNKPAVECDKDKKYIVISGR
ncbi:hypothetical protein EC973_006231 [Apophysomyces ossiformis]|uniref:F-box domain-containing protein n=1 Tax=Apophysomyces ossiformis TaxID=679940 RepID=A0A8H7ELR0_9FUNG|nr:hypothetical protein EC973_006231 [Apophysomyces ossiformis]